MSIHKSLKGAGILARHRNVLSRLERIEKLEDTAKWGEESNSIFGLPKVINRKLIGKKKKKKEKKDDEEEA